MTREKAILVLDSLSTWLGSERPITEEIVEAIKTLSHPSIPSNLDEAAKESAESWRKNPDGSESREVFFQPYIRGFKAGAEWLAVQGQTFEDM